jgi:hypothetical protein
LTEETFMVGFRGLDWIYDVTTDTDTIAARARDFEQRIAATPISQPRNDRDARVRRVPLQRRRRSGRGGIEPSSGGLGRRTPAHRQASAA